ncbi:hypothetical protein AVEN_176953-1 [Araneus ventricosus]|uniref:Uncharacterized protein n=1 Tax=Araneus ventricosus TaxID=182803 RepID=A0A4Y2K6L1_ARAVE|nr:hypothetical protein AVEN_176953-1 [Araneus ventricosus]
MISWHLPTLTSAPYQREDVWHPPIILGVQQAHIHDSSLMESGFEPGALWLRSQDLNSKHLPYCVLLNAVCRDTVIKILTPVLDVRDYATTAL